MPDHPVHLTDERLHVCLERTVELDNVRLQLLDWPGHGRPLLHVADPFSDSAAIRQIAAVFAPRYRVLSLRPRASVPYQVSATDLLGTLDQFGFASPIVLGEGLGCLPALIVAAWYPARVGGLVLIDANQDPSPDDSVEARALRECPPDWPALLAAVSCPVVDVRAGSESLAHEIEAFAAQLT